MAAVQSNTPALRFPEFDGAWEEKCIDDLIQDNTLDKPMDGNHGNIHPKASNYVKEGIPFVMANDIKNGCLDLVNTVKLMVGQANRLQKGFARRGDILLTHKGSVGLTAIVPSLETPYIMLTPQVTYYRIKDEKKLSNNFLRTYFDCSYFQKPLKIFADSGTRPYIGIIEQRKLKIKMPIVEEQKKIADFLTAVDRKIGLLSKKKDLAERYKKGVMQKLFSQSLRFTQDDDTPFPDWKEKKLGKVIEAHNSGIYKNKKLYGSGTNIVGVGNIYSIEAVDGQAFSKVPLSQDEIKKHTLREGDILYSESSLVRSGIAKSVYVTHKGEGTAFAWHTRRLSVNRDIIHSTYLYYYLESSKARKFITSVATQTALTGITTKDYFQTPVCIPNIEEQQKIAYFLSSLDQKITHISQQITQAQAFKKGLLQQMFV